uniref:Uncharacterized protein n=1 Tax=Hyaloperonospora arabidopsidis (strain Emoy2) TaxID=559515 RepID=M4C5H1_HYAAE
MGPPLWIIDVTLSLAATLFGTLGKVLLKLSHTSSQALWVKAAATVCVFLLNPVLDAISYAYAAQSILAPMAGFSVVWNIILSPSLLYEKLSVQDLKGSAVILLGCLLVGLSGSHDTPTHRSTELFALFRSRVFVECHQKSGWRRFAFGALSGLIGGNLFFLKASIELLGEGGAVWSNPETYLIIVAALSTASGGIFVLDQGLREYEALYLVAIYQAILILTGSISGVIFFHEISGMDKAPTQGPCWSRAIQWVALSPPKCTSAKRVSDQAGESCVYVARSLKETVKRANISCLFHESSDTYHCDLRACKKARPTTSAVVTTSRAAIPPPFCYCDIWQRETDFNCSQYLCFSRIERLVISCWPAGNPYWPKRFDWTHTRTCASLA